MMMFRLKNLHILGRKAELAWTIGAVFDFFAVVPWSVHLSGGRSMAWNGSIAC